MSSRFVSVALAVAWRNLHNFFTEPDARAARRCSSRCSSSSRSPAGFLPSRTFPASTSPTGYTTFQYVFVLLQSAAFGGVFTGFSIARDFESGFAPPPAARRTATQRADRRLRAGGSRALDLHGSGRHRGRRHRRHPGRRQRRRPRSGSSLLALLLNVAALLWAAGVAMRFRTIQAGPLMQMPVFLVLFLAPVYVPLDAPDGLDPRGRDRQPGHLPPRGRSRPDRGRPRLRRARLRARHARLVAPSRGWALRGLRRPSAPGRAFRAGDPGSGCRGRSRRSRRRRRDRGHESEQDEQEASGHR